MTDSRTASCACGQLSIEVEGEPAFVASCNCLQCQKRTGSVFGVSSYFPQGQVQPARGYLEELEANPAVGELRQVMAKGPVTLVYGAKDTEHNQAVVLASYLER